LRNFDKKLFPEKIKKFKGKNIFFKIFQRKIGKTYKIWAVNFENPQKCMYIFKVEKETPKILLNFFDHPKIHRPAKKNWYVFCLEQELKIKKKS